MSIFSESTQNKDIGIVDWEKVYKHEGNCIVRCVAQKKGYVLELAMLKEYRKKSKKWILTIWPQYIKSSKHKLLCSEIAQAKSEAVEILAKIIKNEKG